MRPLRAAPLAKGPPTSPRPIVTTDIGGTYARFALATIAGGEVTELGDPVTLKTAEHASFQSAWEEFARRSGAPLPAELAIAFAGPVEGDLLTLTNSHWVIRPKLVQESLGVERITVVNDFGAVAHAVVALDSADFMHLCGPDQALPEEGVITILGPGTGLGVASLLRRGGHVHIIETEGGHIDFASLDALEDGILEHLRRSFGRVSVERLVSGRGLVNLYDALAAIENRPAALDDERALWAAALAGSDRHAAAALDRLCLILGAVAGDLALAQGASAVVIGGGLGRRLASFLPQSGFRRRFIAKGRFERRLDNMPVKLITHPQPGLLGGAAAFARDHS